MAEICVLGLSDDEELREAVARGLKKHFTVWVSGDVAIGDWESAYRRELVDALVVVPILSSSVQLPRANILFDEIRLASDSGVQVLPVRDGGGALPLGTGSVAHVEVNGRDIREVVKEIRRRVNEYSKVSVSRAKADLNTLRVGKKRLGLPAFVFSVSSFETQVPPDAGLELLALLKVDAALVSAYDVALLRREKLEDRLLKALQSIASSNTVLVLDSGNYEAARIRRVLPKGSKFVWGRRSYYSTCRLVKPDAAFAFDVVDSSGTAKEVATRTLHDFERDRDEIGSEVGELWPIVHVPTTVEAPDIAAFAAELVGRVVDNADVGLIAIPERELGPSLLSRVQAVELIIKELKAKRSRCAVHVLGTGNPIMIHALAAAGADSFDGLEWCRVLADHERGHLFHFRHFDLFEDRVRGKVIGEASRRIVHDRSMPYEIRVLSANVDYWADSLRALRTLASSGTRESLKVAHPYARDIFQSKT